MKKMIVYLQGMQIVSQAKKGAMQSLHKDLEDAIPDLKRIGKKIADTLVGLTKDQDKIDKGMDLMKEKMKEGVTIAEKALEFLDLSWSVNISDCELVLLESEWTPESKKKPFGCIKVASFNKEKVTDRFESLQEELINTKVFQILFLG